MIHICVEMNAFIMAYLVKEYVKIQIRLHVTEDVILKMNIGIAKVNVNCYGNLAMEPVVIQMKSSVVEVVYIKA